MTTTDLARPVAPSPVRRPPLLPMTLAAFTAVADATAINVTLPDIRASLGLTVTTASWVVTAYLVALGGLLLLGGRLADVLPRRAVLVSGLGVFLAGAVASALAPSGAVLVTARGLQGAGAAVMLSCALTLLISAFPHGRARARALGLWGVASGAGGTVGVVVGGSLVAGPGWRATFLVGAAGALVALVGALRRLPAEPGAGGRIDVVGAVAVTLGLGALTYALSVGAGSGPTGPTFGVPLVVATVALAVFVHRCRRHHTPLVPPQLLAVPGLAIANLVVLAVGAAGVASFVVVPAYQLTVLGWPGIAVGFGGVPMALAIIVSSVLAPRLAARHGARPVLLVGLIVLAAGLGALAPAPTTASAVAVILPTMLVGIGVGTGFVLATDLGTAGVPSHRAGAASGLLGACREVGGALGVTLSTAAAALLAAPGAGLDGPVGGFGSGYGVAFTTAAAIALGAAVVLTLVCTFRRYGDGKCTQAACGT